MGRVRPRLTCKECGKSANFRRHQRRQHLLDPPANESSGVSSIIRDASRAPTQPAVSRPVYDIAPGLSTPQVDASFPKISRQTYQFMQNIDDSSDLQQHAMTLRSHSIRPASSVIEHGDPGATAMSTNVQSSTVELPLFNHGLVTPGHSPGFIGGEIVSNYMPPAPWDTNFALNPAHISATFQSQPQHVEEGKQLWQPAPAPPASLQLQSSQQSQPTPQLQLASGSFRTQPASGLSLIPKLNHQEQCRRKPRSKYAITSPFNDCIDSFGHKFPLQTFSRPLQGTVNGYIKLSWPLKEGKQSSTTVEVAGMNYNGDSPLAVAATPTSSQSFERSLQRRLFSSPACTSTLLAENDSPYLKSSTLPPSRIGVYLQSPTASFRSYFLNDITKAPQFLPSQFGHDIVMDNMGRKLFSFYTHNWCPGRSVLTKTNSWLTDFASMQHPAVIAAIQSLAGIYVHDYLPCDNVRRLVNKRFAIAEARLSGLLQDADNLDESESGELVTLASLLSMQDVVLTERRLQKPYCPRWLTGFRQAENVLQRTDPGSRFYKESKVQVSALRLSQSVIVGRGVILAQLMMPLPPLATFDPIAETRRFEFLLYGSESDMYEIHGGCGFSKRLLHIFSQVAYCSTRILQECETPFVPITAQMLYDQLMQLQQWSGEYDSWDAAKNRSQPIEWIRQVGENYVVQEAKQMTVVTAEAWRLAGMVYLQCRLLRLPRNHQLVVDNIADLAKCISIMPTSGFIFTAQAPLLPVFLLGLLATVEEHVLVADAWFQHVIETPVRSLVAN
ncbi:hypothetical protein BBAD15_g12251 [Beauveria bassiana D1-5]|uniref:Uncharacterized protein n=1 Tax=Beauveria bassiana D1-5 TaxID=1245745 RepID=A0A0A2V4X7_BEABA|nr:hypothetical protein BBAD15_g12251 [Beauveria bassiana D1-5]